MTLSPEAFRTVLFSLSGLSFGIVAVAVVVFSARVRENPRRNLGFLLVKLAWFLTVGVVFLFYIVPAEAIKPTIGPVIYTLGLIVGSIGFALVMREATRQQNSDVAQVKANEVQADKDVTQGKKDLLQARKDVLQEEVDRARDE